MGDEDIDKFFDQYLDNCEPKDIDTSKSGWSITVRFGNKKAAKEGTTAYRDRKMLETLKTLCYANVAYDPKTNSLTITPMEDATSEFDPIHYQILNKYLCITDALPEARRGQAGTLLAKSGDVEVEKVANVEKGNAVEKIAAETADAMMEQPPIISVMPLPDAEIQDTESEGQKETYKEVLIIVPRAGEKITNILDTTKWKNLQAILDHLDEIASEEELEYEAVLDEDDDSYLVTMKKRPDIKYAKAMDPESIFFIKLFEYSLS